jgi:hypothetical protein
MRHILQTAPSFRGCVYFAIWDLLFCPHRTEDVLPLPYDPIMQTSTEVYRQLKAAEFSESQTMALNKILQTAGIIEPGPPESEPDRLK